MDKEQLKKLFGETGDVNDGLAKMYGSAYLDHPDDTREGIPEDFPDHQNWYDVTKLVRRVIENTKEIDCLTNKTIIIKHLLLYMRNGGGVSQEEMWQAIKHSQSLNCVDPDCQSLSNIFHMDKYLSPEQMRLCHKEDVHNIRARLKGKVMGAF